MDARPQPSRMRTEEPTSFRRRRSFGLGVLVGLAVAGVLGIVLIAPLALAHHDASSLETSYGNLVVSTLARFGAIEVGANPATASAQSLQQGRQSYTGSCSQCHGTAGHTQGVFGQTSFPPATDLSGQSAIALSDGQMFYIIKNGLGFTPMPAFEAQYSDTQIWNMVNFIRSFQTQQAPQLDVPTPTPAQRTTAKVDDLADAARGAEAFAAFTCSACHEPSGSLSINPSNGNVANVVRTGRQGMPCFSTNILSDNQLADIRAYVATFPSEGFLGGPQDQPAAGGGGAPPAGQGSPPAGGVSDGSNPCATSTTTGAGVLEPYAEHELALTPLVDDQVYNEALSADQDPTTMVPTMTPINAASLSDGYNAAMTLGIDPSATSSDAAGPGDGGGQPPPGGPVGPPPGGAP